MEDNAVYRYADWELRPRERTLHVRGELQKIGARAFDVLLALIHHGDRVMSRAELLDAAWPGLVVEENNLSVQVSTLRRLLGSSSIVNVAGLGYRLAAAPADAPTAVLDMAAPVRTAATPSPATGLIGRDDEIAALLPQMAVAPLITVVGTGGVGKSSLARALLAASETTWRDGVHWIDLESLPAGSEVLALVSSALGVEMVDATGLASGDMVRSLSRLDALVVLDNCEHLLEEVTACVAPLLCVAPAIHWLATSQAPLGLASEAIFRLLPLQVAAADATEDMARCCGALALFHRRVLATDRTFELDSASVGTALELCRALDGLPLAIEMAAARVATLGLHGVRDQLNKRLTLRSRLRHSPPRHHTLQSAYEWSHGLLSPLERRLFRKLQPFHGGFTAALLQGFIGKEKWAADDLLDVLASLVDKSLVQKMPNDDLGTATRYRLMESARDFALAQLQFEGEIPEIEVRYAEAVASWFDGAEHDWERWRDAQWSARYVPERENLAAAVAWACASRECVPDLLARLLAAAMHLEAFVSGRASAFRYDVPLSRLQAASPAFRARACCGLGWAHVLDGDAELGATLLEQALLDYDALGDRSGAYLVLTRLIRPYRAQPHRHADAAALWARLERIDSSSVPLRLRIYTEAAVGRHFDSRIGVEHLARLARLATQAGFDSQATACHVNLSDQLLLEGRYAEAVDAAATAAPQGRRFLRLHATLDHNRALALVRLGRINEARRAARLMLRAVPSDAHWVMDLFALATCQESRIDDAALMVGRSAQIKLERHFSAEAAETAVIEDTMRTLRAARTPENLSRLLALGACMSNDDILAIADLI